MKHSIILLIILMIFLLHCNKDSENKHVQPEEDSCVCPMEKIYDNKIESDSSLIESKEDLYDWDVGGRISANIKKIINVQVEANRKQGLSEHQVSSRSIISELKNDYPELISQNFRFKMIRVSFCTYFSIICQDSTMSDSMYYYLLTSKLSEFDDAITEIITEQDVIHRSTQLQNPRIIEKTRKENYRISDNREISSIIYTENQSGGNNTVNINRLISSASYISPNDTIKYLANFNLTFLSQLISLPREPWIAIRIESNSSSRRKVAEDLEKILSGDNRNWALFYKSQVNIAVKPNHAITVTYQPANEQLVMELVDALNPYLSKENIHFNPVNDFVNIEIYLNGTPMFAANGRVTIE